MYSKHTVDEILYETYKLRNKISMICSAKKAQWMVDPVTWNIFRKDPKISEYIETDEDNNSIFMGLSVEVIFIQESWELISDITRTLISIKYIDHKTGRTVYLDSPITDDIYKIES